MDKQTKKQHGQTNEETTRTKIENGQTDKTGKTKTPKKQKTNKDTKRTYKQN